MSHFGRINVVLLRTGRCATAGGQPHHPKGGDGHANYIDLPYPLLDCDDQGKKQKPPLGQVTVSGLLLC